MSGTPWPAGVPFVPLLQGYRRTREDTRVRFQPEVPPPKYRRRHTAVSRMHEMTLRMSRDAALTLDAFYSDVLKDGTLPVFYPEDPIEGDAFDATFETPPALVPTGSFDDGTGDEVWDVSFVLRRLP